MIKPTNQRILALPLETEAKDPNAITSPGTSAELDKFMQVEVYKSSVDSYEKGDIVVVPQYVDRLKIKDKEYFIFHESDVVAVDKK